MPTNKSKTPNNSSNEINNAESKEQLNKQQSENAPDLEPKDNSSLPEISAEDLIQNLPVSGQIFSPEVTNRHNRITVTTEKINAIEKQIELLKKTLGRKEATLDERKRILSNLQGYDKTLLRSTLMGLKLDLKEQNRIKSDLVKETKTLLREETRRKSQATMRRTAQRSDYHKKYHKRLEGSLDNIAEKLPSEIVNNLPEENITNSDDAYKLLQRHLKEEYPNLYTRVMANESWRPKYMAHYMSRADKVRTSRRRDQKKSES